MRAFPVVPYSEFCRGDSEPVASRCHAVDILRKPITLPYDEVSVFAIA